MWWPEMNVMITGASGGLGRSLAVECARRGYRLLLTDINDNGLTTLQRGLERQFGVTVAVKACDLTSDDSVAELLLYTDSQGLQFDMLLNVAGLDHEGGFLDVERLKILQIVDLDVVATLRITHSILQRRRPGKCFYLLFVSSLASLYPMPLKATYAASKRFLLDFSIAIGQELKSADVDVMALCPGGLATTKEALQGIAAQGVWGSMTTNKLESVVKNTIKHLLRGKMVYIPGALNRTMSIMGKLIPRITLSALLYSRWKYAQSKWQALV
jgi:short-subunit dehydrogenase